RVRAAGGRPPWGRRRRSRRPQTPAPARGPPPATCAKIVVHSFCFPLSRCVICCFVSDATSLRPCCLTHSEKMSKKFRGVLLYFRLILGAFFCPSHNRSAA